MVWSCACTLCAVVSIHADNGYMCASVREVVTRVAAIVYTQSSIVSQQADMYCIEWVQHVQLHRVSQGVQMHDSCRCTDTE
jgi:hypothetical protein